MKSTYYTVMPDEETLKRYWGSAEAYLEEQRRTAAYNLEVAQVAIEATTSNTSLLNAAPVVKNSAVKNRLHLPFTFRHLHQA
jgi:hypothetical protein